MIIHLEIPSQNSTGTGKTWRARAAGIKKLRTAWHWATKAAMRADNVTIATGFRTLHIVAYRKRTCTDLANLIGGAKACIDGMVDAGLLVDDGVKHCTIHYAQDVASKSPTKKPCTIIEISD